MLETRLGDTQEAQAISFLRIPRRFTGHVAISAASSDWDRIIVQGGHYLGAPEATVASWLLGLTALVSGCLLLIGFLTPLAGLMVGIDVAGIFLFALPSTTPGVFDSRAALVVGLTILLAIIGAGPGRFSVFGRREIIIPLPLPRWSSVKGRGNTTKVVLEIPSKEGFCWMAVSVMVWTTVYLPSLEPSTD